MKTGQFIATEITLNHCEITHTQLVVVIIITATIYWLLIVCQEFYISSFKIHIIALRVNYYYSSFYDRLNQGQESSNFPKIQTWQGRQIRTQPQVAAQLFSTGSYLLWGEILNTLGFSNLVVRKVSFLTSFYFLCKSISFNSAPLGRTAGQCLPSNKVN